MYDLLRKRVGAGLTVAAVVPLVCGLVFLLAHASRDWPRHWTSPQTLVGNVSDQNIRVATTPSGADVIYSAAGDQLHVARLGHGGTQVASNVSLHGSSSDPTLAAVQAFSVAAWATSAANGDGLRAAILRAGRAPRYVDVVPARWGLEHPMAFAAGPNVDLVYSWQRYGNFDVFLSRFGPNGALGPPIRLTQVRSYAFNPHAAVDATGAIQLVYMDICCGGNEWHMVHRLYSPSGRPLGPPTVLDTIYDIGQAAGSNSSVTVSEWGLDVQRAGSGIWAAWMSNWGQGIFTAAWSGIKTTLRPGLAVPGARAHALALAIQSRSREVIWQQDTSVGSLLATVQLGPRGTMVGEPDRVSFESGSADSPDAVATGNRVSALWVASESGSQSRLETARFSQAELGPPSVWARFGLGNANPIASLAIVLASGLALGLALAAANILLVLALTLVYLVLSRVVRRNWRWYLYLGVLVIALYGIFVQPGAGMPLLLFLVHLHDGLGYLAVGGMAIFILLLTRLVLWRMEDAFRAAVLAFAAVYFIAFLEALTFVQSGVGKV